MGSYGNCMFSYMSDCQIVLECIGEPVSPYLCQHSLLSLFIIFAILKVCSDISLQFLLEFPWWIIMVNTFSCICLSYVYLLNEMSVQGF